MSSQQVLNDIQSLISLKEGKIDIRYMKVQVTSFIQVDKSSIKISDYT